MKIFFNDRKLEDLYQVPIERLGKQPFGKEIIEHYRKKIDILKFSSDLNEVSKFRSLNLEKLNGKAYDGCYSIRVNVQFRIIFKTIDKNKVEILILDLSKHYE